MPRNEPVNRIIGRFVAEMVLASLWSASHMLATRPGKAARTDRTVIFLAVLEHALAADPSGPPTGVSVHALAQSFDRPFESVRRQVNALLAAGWCVREAAGITIAPDKLASAEVQALTTTLHDLLVWLVEQYRDFDLRLPTARGASATSEAGVTLAAIELVLAAVDFAALGYANVREFYVVSSIIAGSVRDLAFSPILSHKFSSLHAVPTDHLRKGVNIARLCEVLGLPQVTVYRQVNAAIALGRLERCPGGIRGTTAHLGSDLIHQHLRLATVRADRAFGRIASEGFPFDQPETRYIGERPVLPNLLP